MNRYKRIIYILLTIPTLLYLFDNSLYAEVYVDTRFNTINESGMGCYQYVQNGGTIVNTQNDSPDPTNALQIYYPQGLQGNGKAGAKCWFVTKQPLTEFYIQYYIKFSSNWQWHPVNQKLVYMYTPSRNTHVTTYAMAGKPGAHLVGILTNTRNLYSNDTNFYFKTGRWYKIYQHYKMNTRDVANGEIQMWVDDVLLVNVQNALILTSALPAGDTGIQAFDLAPVWGGVADVYKDHDDYLWFDRLQISSDPINGVVIPYSQSWKIPNSPIGLSIKK